METQPEEDKSQKPASNHFTFENFMRVPALVFSGIGLIFWPRINYWEYKWAIVNFILAQLSIGGAIIWELIYEVKLFQTSNNMIQGTEINIYMIYSVLSQIKALCIFKNLSKINKVVHTLHDIFPVDGEQIISYNLKEFQRKVRFLTIPVTLVMWLNVSYYVGVSIYMYFFVIDYEKDDLSAILPFYFWYPFEINSSLRYFGALAQQCHASQVVALSVIGSDALLTCILLQICMHLDAISMRFKKRHSNRGDIKDLSIIVHYHNLILRSMDDVNACFSAPVFITFLSSSFVMCFVGFLVVSGTSTLDTIKFALFLLYEMMKVFQISLLGNMLMESSLNIGDSAYNTNWYDNTVQYQKCIQIIIWRAQKPANLNAITLHEVDLTCFKEIVSKAYTFFTLLRTMYNN